MATNPFDQFDTAPQQGTVYGAPPKPQDPPTGYSTDPNPQPLHIIPNGPADPNRPGAKVTWSALSPQEVKARGLDPGKSYQISSEGEVKDLPGVADKGTETQSALEAADQLINAVHRARSFVNDSPYSTGLGYSVTHILPATDAAKLDAVINQELRGNIFLEKIAKMRADNNSPQGGTGIGRIMQAEIPLITGSLGSLDPAKMGRQETLNSLLQIERSALRSKAILNGENPDDPAVAQKYGIPALPNYQNGNLPNQHSSTTPPAPGNNTPPGTPPTGPSGGGTPNPDRIQLANDTMRQMYHGGASTAAIVAYGRAHGLDPNPQQIDQARAKGMDVQFVQPQQPSALSGIGRDMAVGAGGVAQGVGDFLGTISNPFIRGLDALTGLNIRPDMGANVRDAAGLPAPQNNHESLIAAINNYGTQGLGFANAARLAAARVPGVVGSALESLGSRPLTDAASAATGGAASEETRQAGGGPILQTAAGLAAGIPTAAAGNRINALFDRSPMPAVVNAGKAEGVTVNRAMADPSLQPKVIAGGKTMTGAKIMGRNMADVQGQIQGRTQALGQGGQPLENYNLGETAQNIGLNYIKTSGKQFDQQYSALRNASGGVPIPADTALQKIDGILANLNKAPETNAKEINYLQGLRSDLSRGLDVESARDIGSKLNKDIQKGDITFGKSEADVLGIKSAISQDIQNGLQKAGLSGVAKQFKAVDAAYAQRMDFIKNTVQKLTGPRNAPLPPETAASRINAWAKQGGNSQALGRIMAQATPDEQSDIAATFASSLGRDRGGNFSTTALANQIQAMPERTRRIIFGADGAKSMDNLAVLAKEHARVQKALGGSPTALATDARGWLLNALFSGGTGLAEHLAGGGTVGSLATSAATSAGLMAAKVGKEAFSAKALMSPKITGWLRSAPRSNDPQAINQWYDRLKAIAVREPALAPEIQQIQNAFTGAANSNVTPAAAASQPAQQGDN